MAAAVSLATLLVACGAAKPAAVSPEHGSDQKPTTTPWEKKTHQQRLTFMGQVVYPQMKQLFVAFDADAYANFRCQTCHGQNMEAVHFHMPNHLYALPAADPVKEAVGYNARTAQFMLERVLPAMSRLLELPVEAPGSTRGFSCFNCHPKEE